MLGGLLLGAFGCLVTALADGFALAAAGRLVTGTGLTAASFFFVKATLDWFADHRGLPFAMAILLNSWPLGIGVGLVTQGELTLLLGWRAMLVVTAALPVLATALLLALYRDAPGRAVSSGGGLAALRALDRREWADMLLLSAVWSIFNLALVLVFGFAPALLAERGVDLATAGALVSLGNWVGMVALALGGVVASRLGHQPLMIALTTAATGLVFVALAAEPAAAWTHVAFGLAAFAAAGAIMAQPARLVRDETRAAGMGVFYTLFYVVMALGPAVAGALKDVFDATAPLYLGAGLMLVSLLCQALLARPAPLRTARPS
jgi:predicted MFS family arabinose efflux permease